MFGSMSCLALKQVIISGTSAVLWWLAITSVLVFFCRHGAMSSPSSTTDALKKIILWKLENAMRNMDGKWKDWIDQTTRPRIKIHWTYHHNRPCTTTWRPATAANERTILPLYSTGSGYSAWPAAITSSRRRMSVCSRCCLVSPPKSEAELSGTWWGYCVWKDQYVYINLFRSLYLI